ncbi:Retrovirus-related Pol polyprotein from transposon TNT 1-94 [Sesamum angolense]|uniref:Retrovirus-related Pol polyprotein from transposon TNT 1-94 n=1 Tax=Sesamum angolense TaxID=2727404 RepID=A0AAE1WBV2_9LAMI|nr:Retrovirus-related Pol polyprotein from transposon TNT 1-94 [Sesamum angolense]
MTYNSYTEKILKRFKMKNLKIRFLPMGRGVKLSNTQSLKTDEEIEKVREITYALAIGSMQYVGHCTKPDIALDLSVTSTYHVCVGKAHCNLEEFKKDNIIDSTIEVEYITASKATKEVVWVKNYIQKLGVVPSILRPVVIDGNNNRAIAQAKESRSHHKAKNILRCYHLLQEIVERVFTALYFGGVCDTWASRGEIIVGYMYIFPGHTYSFNYNLGTSLLCIQMTMLDSNMLNWGETRGLFLEDSLRRAEELEKVNLQLSEALEKEQ